MDFIEENNDISVNVVDAITLVARIIYLLPDGEKVEEIVADFLENYKKLKGTQFDPDKDERKIWKKQRAFKEFCRKLEENTSKDKEQDIVITEGFDRFARKFGMSPKVGLGVAVALGTVGVGVMGYSISR